MTMIVRVSVVFLLILPASEGYNILAVFAFASKSHVTYLQPLFKALTKKGHRMTIVTPYELPPHDFRNMQTIVPTGLTDKFDIGLSDITTLRTSKYYSKWQLMTQLAITGTNVCDYLLDTEEIKELMSGKQHFDLIIQPHVASECALVFVHVFQCPFITVVGSAQLPWTDHGVWNPNPTSYVPNVYLDYSDHMSFLERVHNTFFVLFVRLLRDWYYLPQLDRIVRRRLGEKIPPLLEIERNGSLVIVNSDPTTDYPRPNLPNVISLSGLHCRPPNFLPKVMYFANFHLKFC